ncbi:hypothetical protein NN3_42510 [Nocardia neocaledoniensis NBRC 108232]|uniref:Uncharacterized protein n=2 Tax=Nocardia neocaledoniensis TaxID=236511 RepID=A0A317NWQ3_9NOCA|nr:hypothetical protein DFR69_102488 [Nocardia neocaledoniensis]GEM33244.1 hypothetical protein NN3_42510 [Nocardia neocaledoniensis NBRC 108232]
MHPPEDRELPSNRAIYGSDTGVMSKVAAGLARTDLTAVLVAWDSMGYDLAPKLLRIYMRDEGPNHNYRFDSAEIRKIVKTSAVQRAAAASLDEVKDLARADPRIGVTREITPAAWIGNVEISDDDDLSNALGHFDVAVGTDTTVYQADDGGLRAEMDYRIYVYDYYNFDLKGDHLININPAKTINNEARQLEEAGWARAFKSRGQSAMLHWSGSL